MYYYIQKVMQLWKYLDPLAFQLWGSYLHHELRFWSDTIFCIHICKEKVEKRKQKSLKDSLCTFFKILQLWAHSSPLAVQFLGSYLHHDLRQFSEYLHRNAIMKAAFNETLWVGTLQYTTQNYISFCYAILKARM